MLDLEALGSAAVSEAALASMVAAAWGVPAATVLSATAEVFPYDLATLTTAGRFCVHGEARVDDGSAARPFALFVKVVQSWARSPMFAFVPEELRAEALRGVPWRTEPLVYGSDLARRLPMGFRMPRALGVVDLDEDSAAVWLERLEVDTSSWDVSRHGRAAYLLGRFAASPAVAELVGELTSGPPGARGYTAGRVVHQVIPALRDDGLWRHPLVAATFDPHLRSRLLAAVDALPGYLDELDVLPPGTAHGDACTRNLLTVAGHDGFTMIDFGFLGRAPLGHDLGQLVLGEVQTGERPAAVLPEFERVCVAEYVRGTQEEGSTATLAQVARAHALLMLIFSGLSAIPLESLGVEPTPELHRVAAERAAAARFILDRVDATDSVRC